MPSAVYSCLVSNFPPHPASFRDPSGYIFEREGELLRYVSLSYLSVFEQAETAGLYTTLMEQGLLVSHALVERDEAHLILKPERLAFISYPYEWCFSQWKDAALCTLTLQQVALEHGFSLKDASAFNIQFHQGKPLLIDTLSFDPYVEGEPWVAYRQFCEHFLAPLALMALTDIRLTTLFRGFLGGIPLDLVQTLLPWSSRLNLHLLAHLHAHSSSQKRLADQATLPGRSAMISKTALLGILDSLRTAVEGLNWKPAGTEWGSYYDNTNYTDAARGAKQALVAEFLDAITPCPAMVWDLGGNTGLYSRIASQRGSFTLSLDIDPAAVEQNWRQVRQQGEKNLLPLLQDLTNPSPSCGWNQAERSSLLARGPADAALALALIHHLAIGNNVPLAQLAAFFAQLTGWLILEFISKDDSQVKRLLAHRKDIFDSYHEAGFEAAFAGHWETIRKAPVPGTHRTLYLLKRRSTASAPE